MMKVLKRILFVIYLILTIFVVAVSAMFLKLSVGIESNGTAELLGKNYTLLKDAEESYEIPKNALLKYDKSDSPYTVNDVVVCTNSDDEIYVGVVSDYSNDADYITYFVDRAGESVQVPKTYVLGEADNYSEFLGGIVAANQSSGARFLFLILPQAVLVLGLAAIIIVVSVKKHKRTLKQRKEDEAQRSENAPLSTLEQHQNEPKKERKTYVNPNSHTELLKYDWLKEVAVAAEENIVNSAKANPSQDTEDTENTAEQQADSDKDDSQTDNAFGTDDKIEQNDSDDETEKADVKPEISDADETEQADEHEPEEAKEVSEKKPANKKSDNDSMINEMLKLINQNSTQDDK